MVPRMMVFACQKLYFIVSLDAPRYPIFCEVTCVIKVTWFTINDFFYSPSTFLSHPVENHANPCIILELSMMF